ncbi:MAG: transcriptional regulator [Brumimicrobium sp.]|nr:transcriptional regulator [Brumimicrobium sp.]
MRKCLFFFFIFYFSFSFGQSYQSEIYYRKYQDSVFKNLFSDITGTKKAIDYLLSEENKMTDTTKALNYNLLGIYLNITGDQDSAIYVFKKALRLSKNHPYRAVKIKSNLGTSYRNLGKYDLSLKEFNELLDHFNKRRDTVGIAKTLGEIAGVYNLTLQGDRAVEHLTKSIAILKKHEDKYASDLAIMEQRLANTFMKQRKFEFALELYNDALVSFKKQGAMSNYYLTLINYAEVLNYLNRRDTALIVINESIAGLKKFDNDRLLAVAYGIQGNIFQEKNQPEKAGRSYKEALPYAVSSNSPRLVQISRDYLEVLINTGDFEAAEKLVSLTESYLPNANIEYQYSYYEVLSDYLSKRGELKSAFEYSILAHELKDSSYAMNKQQMVDELQAKYQLDKKENTNKVLKSTIIDQNKNISNLFLFIALVIVLFIVTAFIWRSRLNLKNKVLELERSRNFELSKKLEMEQENTALRQSLIDQQKAELLTYSLEVGRINERIENFLVKMEQSTDSKKINQELRSLVSVNKSWNSFKERFKEVDPHFVPRLSEQFPKLTQKDLEFCSLVRINISYKDIANFLQISHESVFKKKYRILKKMDLANDVDFQQFIIQF